MSCVVTVVSLMSDDLVRQQPPQQLIEPMLMNDEANVADFHVLDYLAAAMGNWFDVQTMVVTTQIEH